MAALNRIQTLYINADLAGGGSSPVTDSACAAAAAPQWVAGDVFRLRVVFHRPDKSVLGAAPEIVELPSGFALLLAVKASRTSAAALLTSLSSWTAVVDADGVTGYEGILRLDASALITLASGTPAAVWVDLELSDASGNERLTWQWATSVNPQVSYAGDTPADYPPASDPALIAGKKAVAAGAQSVAVDNVGADNAAYAVAATVIKPSAAAADIFVVCVHTITAAGFTAVLSAPPAEEGYYVSYLCR